MYNRNTICGTGRLCSNTGKTGVYFGFNPMISLAMGLEYKKDMGLGQFVVTAPIHAQIGKYSYRNIEPAHYYNTYGRIIPGRQPKPEHNVSHYNNTMLSILDIEGYDELAIEGFIPSGQPNYKGFSGELFVHGDENLRNVRLERTWSISWEVLRDYIKYTLDKFLFVNQLHALRENVSKYPNNKALQTLSEHAEAILRDEYHGDTTTDIPDTVEDYEAHGIITPINCDTQKGGRKPRRTRRRRTPI